MDRFDAGAHSARRPSPEELHALLLKLSPEDQAVLAGVLKDCSKEMTLTRGLPFAALACGSLYVSRHKLKQLFKIGPFRWPFYAFIGVTAITAANIKSLGLCKERMNPHVAKFMEKYKDVPTGGATYDELRRRNREATTAPMYQYSDAPEGGMTYDKLRHQNRGGAAEAQHYRPDRHVQERQEEPVSLENVMNMPPLVPTQSEKWSSLPPREDSQRRMPPPGPEPWRKVPGEGESPALMSGTPGGPAKKSTYGDEGFS